MFSLLIALYITDVTPVKGASEVGLTPSIQLHTSERFDPKSVREEHIQLWGPSGDRIKAMVSSDLGGVLTLSPEAALTPDTSYLVKVTSGLKDLQGKSAVPFESWFRTTKERQPKAPAAAGFKFTKHQMDERDGVCGLTLVGNQLFAIAWDGQLIRYRLDPGTGLAKDQRTIFSMKERRFVAICADPGSTPDRPILWLSHDGHPLQSVSDNDYSAVISRLTVTGDEVREEPYITGLPIGDHPVSGLCFGPDGLLYLSAGATTMLGGRHKNLEETPLSAATLTANVRSRDFNGGKIPLDVRTVPAGTYDPEKGAVNIYATGIREAFDLCWHSNGSLYAGVNMNDTGERTPESKQAPSISAQPAEMLIQIVKGVHYGHPNPSRGEWVLLGGNPTGGKDPWEVGKYPEGTQPDAKFNPAKLIYNLEKIGGMSADGCVEWTAAGPLAGRLIVCFYTATRGLHTFAFNADGSEVTDHQPLVDSGGKPLRFGAPLDVAFHPSGWLYVADFSAPERGDSGKNGGVWLARPVEKK